MKRIKKKICVALVLIFCLCAGMFAVAPTISVQAASNSSDEMVYGADWFLLLAD